MPCAVNPRICPSIARSGLAALLCIAGLGAASGLAAEVTAGPSAAVDFRRDVQPILAQRCYRCHGPDEAKGGLRLNSHAAALAELESGGRAIVPGKPEQSALVERITSTDDDTRMPPEGKPLSAGEVDALKRWITDGATWKNHWAFESLSAVQPPVVEGSSWVRNPIDAFVLSRLIERGLAPVEPASRVALLRRVYYDLTGLPPSPEEVDAFLADTASDAYERAVDRLLDSPRYGEHWARHWLDLVRYADTNSFERDGVKPNAWKYRDYVIRSLNDDKPYDQFVREQIAGDQLRETTQDTLTATGYYRLGMWDDEPADLLQARYDELDDIVTTTSQVFLGLTVNCARCHDHKLDPIPQTDYYRLLAFFHEIPRYNPTACQVDVSPPEVAALHRQNAEEKAALQKQMTPIEQQGIVKMSAEDQRKSEGPERKQLLEEKLRAHLDDEAWSAYEKLKTELTRLEKAPLPPRDALLGIGACLEEPPKTFVLLRGNPHVQGVAVEPGFLVALASRHAPLVPAVSTTRGSSQRPILADWLASPDNPLTARVLVNRAWQFHFGRGLVRSASNFGNLGTPPTHPELLDWLAGQFIASGWRLKPLHRLMVTANTYRLSSAAREDALAKDPENDLYWRFDMRRLSAEEVRDSMLTVSGKLNPRMYGPGVFPKMSRAVLESQSIPGNGWDPSPPDEQNRRSVYIHIKRSLVLPILAEFDVCDTDNSCAVRFSTTQPTQALGMLHGEFAREQAVALAERLREHAPNDVRGQVERAWRLAAGRQASERDLAGSLRLIASLQSTHGVSDEKALEYFCLTMLNLNEFIYLE